jgi:hypothetical protein
VSDVVRISPERQAARVSAGVAAEP